MNKRRQDALRALGFDIERYYVEGFPPVWGLALTKNGEDVVVIESHGCHTDNDRHYNKFIVRSERARNWMMGDRRVNDRVILGPELRIFKTQREAAAWAARRYA